MKNLLNELAELLAIDSRLVQDGKLVKNKIIELALNLDSSLLRLLISNESIKNCFFVTVDEVLVFDKLKFQKFISNKEFLPDSYTAFGNKIGLTMDSDFLVNGKSVVLSWPYKDCFLEGGQEKDDAKRKEIFWNEILGADQIDRLISKKALTKFKKINSEGESSVDEINPDANLVIKGNNLLALHTIKEKFAGSVKSIYIDPPFNTDTDSFLYNDSFTHSAWLTFMKNRLEVAYELLRDDGAIFIHLDHQEAPYCKVLMDEIFGRENWVNTFTITTNDPSGFKATGKSIFSTANQIFFYAKNKNRLDLKKHYIENEYDSNYGQYLKDRSKPINEWEYEPLNKVVATQLGFESPRKAKAELGEIFDEKIAQYAFENASNVFRTAAIQGGARAKRINTINKSLENRGKVFVHPDDDIPNFYILNGEGIIFYENRLVEIDGKLVAGKLLTDVWTDIKVTGIAEEGGVKLKNGKKPERLIKRILDISTAKGDLVCDFFGGSGTTAAVAHKMGRRYITIEQMDYVESITLQRIKNVILGDRSGISESEKWFGGGEVIYCELAKLNQKYVDLISQASSTDTLASLYEEIQKNALLSYKIDPKALDIKGAEFTELNFEDQKRLLIEILDKNMLYIPLSEIEDESYGFDIQEMKINKQFLG
jgi:adenine-specific DNA-methyltransferase